MMLEFTKIQICFVLITCPIIAFSQENTEGSFGLSKLIESINRSCPGSQSEVDMCNCSPSPCGHPLPESHTTQTNIDTYKNHDTKKIQSFKSDVKLPMTVLTRSDAEELFREIVGQDDYERVERYSLRNIEICRARAMLIAYELEKKGISSAKILVTNAVLGKKSLTINKSATLKSFFNLTEYHQSNLIMIKEKNGAVNPWIIDPFLFPNGPVPKSEFEKLFKDPSNHLRIMPASFFYNSKIDDKVRAKIDDKDVEAAKKTVALSNKLIIEVEKEIAPENSQLTQEERAQFSRERIIQSYPDWMNYVDKRKDEIRR